MIAEKLVECSIVFTLDLEIRPLVKSVYQKNNFLISQPKHVLWVNRLNETVLLSTQNMFKLMGKKIFTFLRFGIFMLKIFVYLNLWVSHSPSSSSAGCILILDPRKLSSIFV